MRSTRPIWIGSKNLLNLTQPNPTQPNPCTPLTKCTLENTNAHSAILFVVVPRLIGNPFDPLALPISKNASLSSPSWLTYNIFIVVRPTRCIGRKQFH